MNKITLISGYYYPEDTAIGLYNTQMITYLEEKGYEVTIVTGFPNYPQWKIREDYKAKNTFLKEQHNDTKILRYKQFVPSEPNFLKRILLIIDFTFGSFVNILKIKQCDLVISVVPFSSTILLGWVLKKRTKAKLWSHIQDFEFDAAQQTGVSQGSSVLKKVMFKLLFKLERFLLNRSDLNSTISLKMIEKLSKKTTSKTYYFPNWVDQYKINPTTSEKHPYLNTDAFKILYSGNIGDKQDWEFFLSFAKKIANRNVEIVIVGDGAKKEWLAKEIQDINHIKCYNPIKYEDLSNLLCSTDLHILFQKLDVVDSVMPSKLLAMMASAKPSLITGNEASEVKTSIENSKGGFYISERDVDKCVSVVNSLIENPDELQELGKNARQYIISKFSRDEVLSDFEKKLSTLIN